MTLNIAKTKYMTFSIDGRNQPGLEHQLTLHNCTNLSCCCQPLERAANIKYLGIQIDMFLRWQNVIDETTLRIRKLIYIFKNIRNILSPSILKTIYFALAQSVINHGLIGWGGAAKTILDPLKRAQKSLIRVINKKPFRYPSDILFNDFKVLDIRQLYIRTVLKYYHRKDKMTSSNPEENGRKTRQTFRQTERRMNTTYGQRHYVFTASRLYNKLAIDLQPTNVSYAQFGKMVSSWLFARSRSQCEDLLHIVT